MAIKVRDFEVRLTRNKEERRMVRNLRYDVFVVEEGATATAEQHELHEEFDDFDIKKLLNISSSHNNLYSIIYHCSFSSLLLCSSPNH